MQGNLIVYYPVHERRLLKWRQRAILHAMVILQGNMIEYYPAHDMLSTSEISNLAYEY